MNVRAQIENHIQAATKLALAEVERQARAIMVKHPAMVEFVMAMGTASFVDKQGEPVFLDARSYLKTLDRFICDHDNELHITGWPMRFTATGPVVTDW